MSQNRSHFSKATIEKIEDDDEVTASTEAKIRQPSKPILANWWKEKDDLTVNSISYHLVNEQISEQQWSESTDGLIARPGFCVQVLDFHSSPAEYKILNPLVTHTLLCPREVVALPKGCFAAYSSTDDYRTQLISIWNGKINHSDPLTTFPIRSQMKGMPAGCLVRGYPMDKSVFMIAIRVNPLPGFKYANMDNRFRLCHFDEKTNSVQEFKNIFKRPEFSMLPRGVPNESGNLLDLNFIGNRYLVMNMHRWSLIGGFKSVVSGKSAYNNHLLLFSYSHSEKQFCYLRTTDLSHFYSSIFPIPGKLKFLLAKENTLDKTKQLCLFGIQGNELVDLDKKTEEFQSLPHPRILPSGEVIYTKKMKDGSVEVKLYDYQQDQTKTIVTLAQGTVVLDLLVTPDSQLGLSCAPFVDRVPTTQFYLLPLTAEQDLKKEIRAFPDMGLFGSINTVGPGDIIADYAVPTRERAASSTPAIHVRDLGLVYPANLLDILERIQNLIREQTSRMEKIALIKAEKKELSKEGQLEEKEAETITKALVQLADLLEAHPELTSKQCAEKVCYDFKDQLPLESILISSISATVYSALLEPREKSPSILKFREILAELTKPEFDLVVNPSKVKKT